MRIFLTLAFAMAAGSAPMHATAQNDAVNEYLKRLPYQETFNYMMNQTGGDPAKLNTWAAGAEPVIFKAGEDMVVRMNNDTFYKQAYADLSQGPVVLTSENADPDRFSSFQLMDDRNVNFRNIIRPEGSYVLYFGKKPETAEGELIEAPSKLVPVVVRVEVKDPHDPEDVVRAEAVHKGIGITGPAISSIESLDLLSEFDEQTVETAEAQMEEVMKTVPFRDMVAGPGDVPDKVSYLLLAASAKHAWGGPVPSHSAYEAFFADEDGDPLQGANGPYAITTAEPPVDAFWSVTVYDTATGRFFDNPDDRYHINNTMAEKNADGTVTFLFKTTCTDADTSCLHVPEGAFDISARYYLPGEAIQTGEWTMPKPRRSE